ncbi:hypothetical protein GOODEAATRI_025460, partial [Goodea atripinnis]
LNISFVSLLRICKATLTDIIRHFDENGARPRLRKKSQRPQDPHFISSEKLRRVLEFIKNYAEDHAMMLPGERAICKSTFKALWTQLPQHIRSYRPCTDLCWQCQENNDQLLRSANLPEERKTAAIKKQQEHLQLVQKERAVYNEKTAACKKINCLSAPPHLQMHFPSNPLQPGPMYFLTPRKCGLFGVSCEGLQKQVNFLIDEGMSSGKGSNEVSYMHHFFTHFRVRETDVDLHCDNWTGQNKNNFMLWYGAWRVAHKLHSTLNIHFEIAGHTKFAPDCGFGLIKQAYKRTRVSTVPDIAKVSLFHLIEDRRTK